MNLIRAIRENVGWKIAVITSISLLFVALLLIVSFSFIPVQLFSKFNLIQILVVLVTLLTFLSVLVINIATVALIQRPLDRLIHAISQAERGNLTVRAHVDSVDEIGELTTKFNEMLHQIGELDQRKIKTERELILAQEDLKYKKMLEEKAGIIEETNRQLARSLKDLSVLYRVNQMVSSTIVPEELYNVLVDVVVETLGFQEFALLVFDEESRRLRVKVASGFKDNQKIKELTFGLGEGICGQVAKTRESIYIRDTSKDSSYLHYKGEKMEEGSFLSLPIISHNRLLGVMNFSRPGTDSFSSMDVQLLNSLASQVGVAIENARLYAKTKDLSVTDELTHIYNRRHFQTMLQMELKRARRFNRNVSLLMVDVDHFKKYNDTHGHMEGDRVLEEIAKILSENVREVDTVARYGGEEFSIILTHTTSDEATQVAKKLCRLVEGHPFKYEKNTKHAQVTISVGVANFPENAENLEELINHADMALYEAKGSGRNQVVRFDQMKSSGLRAV
jgi:diguanylate cyclase (GGDEF)-like protein